MIAFEFVPCGDRRRVDLDQVRARIEAVKAEIEAVSNAPLPVAEAVQRAIRAVRERAAVAENRFGGFAFAEGGFVPAGAPRSGIDVLAVLFNVAPELVEKGLRAHLAPLCKDGVGTAERGARIAKLKDQLAALKDKDEELTIRLLLDGLVVERSVPETPEEIDRMLDVWDRTAA